MVGEIVFAMNEDLFCTSHLEKCGGWMVMGQVRKFFEKTEGGQKGFCKPKIVFCKPEKVFATFEGARFFFAKVVPHPQV